MRFTRLAANIEEICELTEMQFMGRPLLTSFQIQGLRGIGNLLIDKIGRVNLIVGKNSCGKTSVLEALQLYASHGAWGAISAVLTGRNEVVRMRLRNIEQTVEFHGALQNLFYGATLSRESAVSQINISTADPSDRSLVIRMAKFRSETSDDGRQLKLIDDSYDDAASDVFGLSVTDGDKTRIFPLDRPGFYSSINRDFDDFESEKYVAISTSGLSEERMGRLWDRITLTESEDAVVDAIRIIAPDLERISLIQGSGSDRSFMVRLKGHRKPIPLRVMGDGLSRLMGIALALVNAADGVLIIDEIENGLHYSVQKSVWDLIFQTAKNLNVQVFAATHSWDCVSSFQEAASDDKNEGAYLLRVQSNHGEASVVSFDESELAIATRDGIEVR